MVGSCSCTLNPQALLHNMHDLERKLLYIHRVPKFTSCRNAIMVVTGRAHCSIVYYAPDIFYWALLWIGWKISQRDRRSLFAFMHCPLLAVWALWWLHNAIQQCVTVHRVPKFTSCHNAIMVVTGRVHCSIVYYASDIFCWALLRIGGESLRFYKDGSNF